MLNVSCITNQLEISEIFHQLQFLCYFEKVDGQHSKEDAFVAFLSMYIPFISVLYSACNTGSIIKFYNSSIQVHNESIIFKIIPNLRNSPRLFLLCVYYLAIRFRLQWEPLQGKYIKWQLILLFASTFIFTENPFYLIRPPHFVICRRFTKRTA